MYRIFDNDLIFIVTHQLIGLKYQIIMYNLCCLRHNKTDIENISICSKFLMKKQQKKIIRNEAKYYLSTCYLLSDDFCFSKEPLDKRPSSGYAGFKGTLQNSVTAPFDDLAIYKRHLDVKDDDIVTIDMVSDHLLTFFFSNTCALS